MRVLVKEEQFMRVRGIIHKGGERGTVHRGAGESGAVHEGADERGTVHEGC